MATHVLPESRLVDAAWRGEFAERLIAVASSTGPVFRRLDDDLHAAPALRAPRGPTSAKAFCFPPRELVARYSGAASVPPEAVPRRLIFGARACELRALRYLDKVFGAPPEPDPIYQAHRAQLVVVSVDCVEPHAHCFCNLVDGKPYAELPFDVNVTPVSGGYVVEAGSSEGEAYVAQLADLLSPAMAAQLQERDAARQKAEGQLRAQNAGRAPTHVPADVLAQRQDDPRWDGLGAGCVECGACTQICPTCHCFFLLDRGGNGRPFERLRAWDSCMWSGYSRMAGAAGMKPNPRAQFRSRFANRFLHKFLWSPQQWDLLGCVGCGRCFDACPGAIDVRSVLQEAVA